MQIDLNDNLIQFAKVIALFFGMFHLLVGFVLVRRVARINGILHSRTSIIITLMNYIYIAILIGIIAFIILL